MSAYRCSIALCIGLLAAPLRAGTPLAIDEMRVVGGVAMSEGGELRIYAANAFVASVRGGYPAVPVYALIPTGLPDLHAGWRLDETMLGKIQQFAEGSNAARRIATHHGMLEVKREGGRLCLDSAPACISLQSVPTLAALFQRATEVARGCAPAEGDAMDGELHAECARALFADGAYPGALVSIKRALDAADPAETQYMDSLNVEAARILIAMNEADMAIGLLDTVLSHDSGDARALVFRARAWLLKGGLDGADRSFADLETARSLWPASLLKQLEDELPPLPQR